MMVEGKPANEQPCETGSGFIIPGTQDAACNKDPHEHLEHCAHCGASLSPNSEFCHVCSTAVSGGEEQGGADESGVAGS